MDYTIPDPGRSKYIDMTQKINDELKKYAETKEYIYFVDAEKLTYDGKNLDETLFREDKIHLNHEGELRWYREFIRPAIENVIQEYQLEVLKN